MKSSKEHWEGIYQCRTQQEMSWIQPEPKASPHFLRLFGVGKKARILDVGGGDSLVVDYLLAQGYTNLAVLDISAASLERAIARLGKQAADITWIESDVTEFEPTEPFDFWYDRATFHFLTQPSLTARYIQVAKHSITAKGKVVIGTFSESGPDKCSGLEVHKYSQPSLSEAFSTSFKKIECVEEDHITPFQTHQSFVFCGFENKASE